MLNLAVSLAVERQFIIHGIRYERLKKIRICFTRKFLLGKLRGTSHGDTPNLKDIHYRSYDSREENREVYQSNLSVLHHIVIERRSTSKILRFLALYIVVYCKSDHASFSLLLSFI